MESSTPRELGEEWLARALQLAAPGTEARGYAAAALALSSPETGAQVADEVLAVAQSLGHRTLVGTGFEAKMLVATVAGYFGKVRTWADRALDATHASNVGYRANRLWSASLAYLRAGRVEDVRCLAEAHRAVTRSLGPHDEVHALAHQAVLESVLGRWDALAELTSSVESASAANTEFPCQFSWRSPLVCALGVAHLDRSPEVAHLVELGREGAVVAGPAEREPALLRLALLLGDLDEAERILALLPAATDPWGFDGAAARLDALVALGRKGDVEVEAAPFLERESYTRPRAVRSGSCVAMRRSLTGQLRASTRWVSSGAPQRHGTSPRRRSGG